MTIHLPRRGFISGAIGLLAAPAIVRADRIMRVKKFILAEQSPIFLTGQTSTFIYSNKIFRYYIDPKSIENRNILATTNWRPFPEG